MFWCENGNSLDPTVTMEYYFKSRNICNLDKGNTYNVDGIKCF